MRYRDEFDDNEVQDRAVALDGRSALVRMIEDRPADLVALLAAGLIACGIIGNALVGQNGPHPAPLFAAAKSPPKPVAAVAVQPAPQPRPAEVQKAVLDNRAAEPAVPRAKTEIIADMQRELKRLGLYEGAVDGKRGPKTDAAIRDFATNIGMKQPGEPSEELLARMKRTGQNRASGVEPQGQMQSQAELRSIDSLITATASPQPSRAETRPAAPAPAAPKSISALIAATDQTPVKPPESFSQRQTLAIEQALARAGFMPGRVDGVYDRETRTAIERFERERRLPVTGGLSSQLVKELAAATGSAVE